MEVLIGKVGVTLSPLPAPPVVEVLIQIDPFPTIAVAAMALHADGRGAVVANAIVAQVGIVVSEGRVRSLIVVMLVHRRGPVSDNANGGSGVIPDVPITWVRRVTGELGATARVDRVLIQIDPFPTIAVATTRGIDSVLLHALVDHWYRSSSQRWNGALHSIALQLLCQFLALTAARWRYASEQWLDQKQDARGNPSAHSCCCEYGFYSHHAASWHNIRCRHRPSLRRPFMGSDALAEATFQMLLWLPC